MRNVVSLSVMSGTTITNLRRNRNGKGGLKGSHTAAIKFMEETCHVKTIDSNIGSQTIHSILRLNILRLKGETTTGRL